MGYKQGREGNTEVLPSLSLKKSSGKLLQQPLLPGLAIPLKAASAAVRDYFRVPCMAKLQAALAARVKT